MSKFHDELVPITYVNTNRASWEWGEWNAYYHPSNRKYYVGEDGGCSCNWYEIEEAVDESEGLHSKQDLLNRLRQVPTGTEEYVARPEDISRAQQDIRDFDPKED